MLGQQVPFSSACCNWLKHFSFRYVSVRWVPLHLAASFRSDWFASHDRAKVKRPKEDGSRSSSLSPPAGRVGSFFFVDQVLLPQKSRGLRLQRVGLGDVGDDSTGQSLGEEDPQVKILRRAQPPHPNVQLPPRHCKKTHTHLSCQPPSD